MKYILVFVALLFVGCGESEIINYLISDEIEVRSVDGFKQNVISKSDHNVKVGQYRTEVQPSDPYRKPSSVLVLGIKDGFVKYDFTINGKTDANTWSKPIECFVERFSIVVDRPNP